MFPARTKAPLSLYARDTTEPPATCPVVYTVPGGGPALTCDDLVNDYGYTCEELALYAYDCTGCMNCDEDTTEPDADFYGA